MKEVKILSKPTLKIKKDRNSSPTEHNSHRRGVLSQKIIEEKKEAIKIKKHEVKEVKIISDFSVYIKIIDGLIYISKFKNENFNMYEGKKLSVKEYGLNTENYIVFI